MTNLEVFNYENNNVRTFESDGEVWFVAKDVCDVLGHTDVSTAVRRLDEDEKLIQTLFVSGQNREVWLINEPGLYNLVATSRLKGAKKFNRWVRHEVLPSIRKTGSYHADIPKSFSEALRAYADAVDEKLALEHQIERDKPRVLFSQAVEASEDSVLIGDLAKVIKQNGIDVGQNRLFAWMRDNGYLIKSGTSRNMPTQYSMDREWFEVQQRVIHVPDREPKIKSTTRVTGKGQMYFVNKFISDYKKAQ